MASANITSKAKISNLVKFISLKSSLDVWANEVIKYGTNYERDDMRNIVINNGYDVTRNTELLQKHYIELYEQTYMNYT